MWVIHQTSNYTGLVVSGFLAAWIGKKWGWRMSFLTFGIAGIIWAALVAWRLKDAPRSAAVSTSGTAGYFPRRRVSRLARLPFHHRRHVLHRRRPEPVRDKGTKRPEDQKTKGPKDLDEPQRH